MEPDIKGSSQSFELFSNLPAELRMQIWEVALEGREGRIIIPRLECIQPPHSSKTTGIDCRCSGHEFPPCCENYTIRTPIPPLLRVCNESRDASQQKYIHKQGGLSDPTRDKLLVRADGLRITSWCKIHNRVLKGRPPIAYLQELAHRHVLYYIPELKSFRGRPPGWQDGIQLRIWFREQGRGQSVETITVLTNGAGTAEEMASFWSALEEMWEDMDKAPEDGPMLIHMHDAATTQEVERLIAASDQRASRN
ncbi:hypothetical protein B0J14DRAFT_188253 [Halenospora varia]|nr:hypothetical protein B0J14DRAFT_188253 [Halenospora varia]